MKILFWFRKSEATSNKFLSDPNGTIQCRITIDNDELELGSTKIQCVKSYWHAQHQTIIGKKNSMDNRRLTDISTTLLRLFDMLKTRYEYVTPSLVKDYYYSKKKFQNTVEDIKREFQKTRLQHVELKIITKTTYDVNENYLRHILTYSTQMKYVYPIHLPNTYFQDLYHWLILENVCQERMARKVTCFAKQLLKFGKSKKYCPELSCFQESLPGMAESEDYIDTTHLTVDQIEHLYHFDFFELVKSGFITEKTARILHEERNAFVFNCFTGMHHCDYTDKAFTITLMYNSLFLRGYRKKTKKSFAIKLLEPAVEILKQYGNDLHQLPSKSNQKRNQTLKQIAVYTGIPLLLSTKIARKTFCDIALNELMMTADDVAACLGLTNTKYLKNYGKIREKRLAITMKSWQSIKSA